MVERFVEYVYTLTRDLDSIPELWPDDFTDVFFWPVHGVNSYVSRMLCREAGHWLPSDQ